MSSEIKGRTWQAGRDANLLQILWEIPLLIAAALLLPAYLLERRFFKEKDRRRTPNAAFRKLDLILAGLSWGFAAFISLWVTLVFGREGRGTPVPSSPPRQLVIAGPFKYARHPMYVAFLLIFYGAARILRLRTTFHLIFLFILYLRHHARGEEEVLVERFGDAYRKYQKQVPGGLPFI